MSKITTAPTVDVSNLPIEKAVAKLIEYASSVSASDLFLVSESGVLSAQVRHLGHVRKISRVPLEYSLEGLRQSQVNPAIELGFAELFRSVLRQSPDVIMLGEIRDPETADTAVRAANSGHLVMATVHAPTAAGAIQSMRALGI